jgi:hypothetical protein
MTDKTKLIGAFRNYMETRLKTRTMITTSGVQTGIEVYKDVRIASSTRILKDHSAFRLKQSPKDTLQSFQTSGTTCSMTLHHVPYQETYSLEVPL